MSGSGGCGTDVRYLWEVEAECLHNHSVRNTVKPAKKTKITKHLLIKSRESFILLR